MDRGLADVVLILISTSALKGPSYPIGHGQERFRGNLHSFSRDGNKNAMPIISIE